MTQTKRRFTSIEEYLEYEDGTDTRYEVVNGVLVEMPTESPLNLQIAIFLLSSLIEIGVPYYLLSVKTELQVTGRTVTVRYADLLVMTKELDAALAGKPRSLVTLALPAPALVVEVVSPGKPGTENYDQDYIDKRREYAERGIPEYWLIDPDRNVVIVLQLEAEQYIEVGQFRNSDVVISPTFSELRLTAEAVLRAGR